MSRKQKPPPKKPSKAYLVSFGDTMTALLAFFIVLNSFAKDQTGANMHMGTGSYVQAMKSIGFPGRSPGDRSDQMLNKTDAAPIYAVESKKIEADRDRLGPDESNDRGRIVDRQSDNFQRFLSEMQYQFQISETAPTQSQIVFDSFENLGSTTDTILGSGALQLASDSISQLGNDSFELEVIVWATMPSPLAIQKAMDKALMIEAKLEKSFMFRGDQRARISVSAKPWLFVDAARPRMSFVLSRLER